MNDGDGRLRPGDARSPLLLKAGALRRLLGLGHTKFWELKRAGAFDQLAAPVKGYYSALKVERWLSGDDPEAADASSAGRHFFGSGKRAKRVKKR